MSHTVYAQYTFSESLAIFETIKQRCGNSPSCYSVPTFPEMPVLLRIWAEQDSTAGKSLNSVRELSGSTHDYSNGHSDPSIV
jgi:hypothetical protein